MLKKLKTPVVKKAMLDKRGGILIPVMVISMFLFILATALASRITTTANINSKLNTEENAYLAARSGLQLLVDRTNDDRAFGVKVFNAGDSMDEAVADSKPISLNLGDTGSCYVSLTRLCADYKDADDNTVRQVKVKATGYSQDGKDSFTITRKLTIKKKDDASTPVTGEVNPAALQMYDDTSIEVAGGIDGDVYIMGNGTYRSYNGHDVMPNQRVIVRSGLALPAQSDGSYYETVVSGKYVSTVQTFVRDDLSAGADDTTFGFDKTNAFIYNSNQLIVGGVVRCSGDVILGGSKSRIAYHNIDAVDTTTYDWSSMSHPVAVNKVDSISSSVDPTTITPVLSTAGRSAIISEGNVYIDSKAIVTENDSNNTTYAPVLETNGHYKLASSSVLNGVNRIYGDIICKGAVELGGDTAVYGNIYCDTCSVVSNNVKVYGTIYTTSGLFANPGGSSVVPFTCAVDSAGKHLNVDSGSSANFDSYASGMLTPPKTNIPTECDIVTASGMSVTRDKDDLAQIDGDVAKAAITGSKVDSFHFTRTAFYAADGSESGEDYSALLLKEGSNEWANRNLMLITKSCVLQGDFDFCDFYVDTAHFTTPQNIDIFVEGSVKMSGADAWGNIAPLGFAVNDNQQKNRIRIFLMPGSSLELGGGWRNIYVVSGGADFDSNSSNDSFIPTYGKSFTVADTTVVDSLFTSNTATNSLLTQDNMTYLMPNPNKIARLYILAEDKYDNSGNIIPGYTEPYFDTGATGRVNGYVVAPTLELSNSSNTHHYEIYSKSGSGASATYTKNTMSENSYPLIYGMLMAKKVNFTDNGSTYVVYDPRLVDPARRGLSGAALTAAQAEFDAQLAMFRGDVGAVMTYTSVTTPSPSASGLPISLTAEIDEGN